MLVNITEHGRGSPWLCPYLGKGRLRSANFTLPYRGHCYYYSVLAKRLPKGGTSVLDSCARLSVPRSLRRITRTYVCAFAGVGTPGQGTTHRPHRGPGDGQLQLADMDHVVNAMPKAADWPVMRRPHIFFFCAPQLGPTSRWQTARKFSHASSPWQSPLTRMSPKACRGNLASGPAAGKGEEVSSPFTGRECSSRRWKPWRAAARVPRRHLRIETALS